VLGTVVIVNLTSMIIQDKKHQTCNKMYRDSRAVNEQGEQDRDHSINSSLHSPTLHIFHIKDM